MFGLFRGKGKKKAGPKKSAMKRAARGKEGAEKRVASVTSDFSYDIMKKLSDIQDQVSRHDSRILGRIEEHDAFLREDHHEPMKNAAIEIMNKIYTQSGPIREEVVRIIKSDEKIISVIGDGRKSAEDVAKAMGLSREHVSRRISTLTKNGMLVRIQDGKRVFYARPEDA